MAININRYVNITSGVGAGTIVPRRELIARLFTNNNLLPPQTYVEFTSASAVGAYFGVSSEEYLRSLFYFSWVSKNISRPQKISFARWANVAVAPRIYGQIKTQALGTYTSISAGTMTMTIGADVNNFTGIDFSAAASLSDVAAILQTKIRTGTGTGAMWSAAIVTYNASRGTFDFVGGATTAVDISVTSGVSADVAAPLGWVPAVTYTGGVASSTSSGAIWARGSLAETNLGSVVEASAAQSNNFASFLFMPTLAIDQVIALATWNHTQNVSYAYLIPVITANVATWSSTTTGVGAIGGCALTLSDINGEYPEMVPAMIAAATNYGSANSVQNYEFQIVPGLTPSVTTDAAADTMDTARVNYYGRTQDAGVNLDFYQQGSMMGVATDPLAMNTYYNEIWLKDAAAAAIMNLLLTVAKISANAQGRSQVLGILQAVVNDALNNGTISVGKTLTEVQKLYITETTGDDKAWYQVQTIGYWMDCVMVQSTIDPTKYEAVYTLIYSKDDVINKVIGTQILI